MMTIVYNQLAIDYNCKPEDFYKNGVIFTIAEKHEGRREMPFITPRLEIITMGKGTIVNVSKNIISFAKRKFEGKSSYEILTSKFVYGVNPYYLPDVENLKEIENKSFRFELIDSNIQLLYSNPYSFFSCYVQSGAMFSVLLFSVKYKLFEKISQQKTAVYKTAVFTIIV